MDIKNLKLELKTKGYVKVKNIVTKDSCETVLKNTFALIKYYYPIFEKFNYEKPWEIDECHAKFLDLRKSDPELFGVIYDATQSSVALDKFVLQDKIISTIADLLGTDTETISSSGHIQRMDPPHDEKNLYKWHQERSYYPQNKNGLNGMFVWIPLMDIPINGGALCIAEGSHKEGFIKTKSSKDSKIHSTQYAIPEKIVKEYNQIISPIKCGDALIMYMTTMHKSNINMTNRFRFNAIARFHNNVSGDFIPFRYIYKQNERIIKELS